MLEELNPRLAAQPLARRARAAEFLFEHGGFNAAGAEHVYLSRIMARHVRAARARVDAGGLAAFTLRQRVAVGNHPNLWDAFRGNRIDAAARRTILNDPILQPLFGAGRLRGSPNRGPDFRDTLTGQWWDMTTPGQWNAHLTRYGPGGTLLPTQ